MGWKLNCNYFVALRHIHSISLQIDPIPTKFKLILLKCLVSYNDAKIESKTFFFQSLFLLENG